MGIHYTGRFKKIAATQPSTSTITPVLSWVTDPNLLTQNEGTVVDTAVVALNAVSYALINGTTLPSGLTMSGLGIITGTLPVVTSNTDYTFDVRATDANSATIERTFTIHSLNVAANPSWTTGPNLLTQNEGTAVNTVIAATGADGIPVTYSLVNSTTLPGTLTLTANTGAIAGTLPRVTANTTFTFDARATTAEGTADRTFMVNAINVPAAPVWNTNSGLLLSGVANSVSYQLSATGSDGISVTYSLANSTTLPSGLALSNSGLISGIMTTVSSDVTSNFSVTAGTVEGNVDRSFSITNRVQPQPPIWETGNSIILPESTVTNYQLLATNNTDPLYANVSAQFSFSNLDDQSPNAYPVINNGTVTVSSAQSKFGGTSALFNTGATTSGNYLSLPLAASNFGTGDFTIEAWCYQTEGTNPKTIFGQREASFKGFNIVHSTSSIQVWKDSVTMINYSGSFALNTWRHIAVVRQGINISLYINGTLAQTVATFGAAYPSDYVALPKIGSEYNTQAANQSWTGYLDNFRITKAARYTANFTPQSADVTNTGMVYGFVSGTMPAGLTFNSNGVLTGTTATVTSNTVVSFVANATSTNGSSTSKNFTVTTRNV